MLPTDQDTRTGKRQADALDEAIGSRVRTLRRRRGMSQTALAGALGLSYQQMQKYERGSSRMPVSILVQIARALDVEVNRLIGEDGEVPVHPPAASGEARASEDELQTLVDSFASLSDPSLRAVILRIIAQMAEESRG
jgi:transcriptional regulator with XRE-family HTH domain